MTIFDHQLVTGATLSAYRSSGATVSGSARTLTEYVTRKVQAALAQHPQAYVQHVEVMLNDDTGFNFLLDLDHLQRFRKCLNARIRKDLAAKGFGGKAALRCEWFVAHDHHERLNLNILTFLGQKAFYLLGDERESSRTALNRHMATAWEGMQELSAEHNDHVSSIRPRGCFYLSDRAGDRGVATLIQAMCNVAE
jgi:hypothetical protein